MIRRVERKVGNFCCSLNSSMIKLAIERSHGMLKQSVGEAVGSDELANRGVVDQVKGAAKETWGDARDAANKIKEFHEQPAGEEADEKRGKISQSIEDVKEKVKDKIEDFKERHTA
jgi:uncharacterized protein YjbJ (UPF0337 family)